MGKDLKIVKKGKDCFTVAKNALDEISTGKKAMVLNKLSALQTDGSFLADIAKQLVERLEAMEKYYQQKDAEILREIEDLSRRENELQSKKSEEENQLAAHQDVLQDNQNRLTSEENRLGNAEQKLRGAKEEEKIYRLDLLWEVHSLDFSQVELVLLLVPQLVLVLVLQLVLVLVQ